MKERIKRWLPTRDTLHNSRWLRWLGPALHHPRLWHMSRKGVAMGLALGIFFGLLIPVAQIPFSAALAVLLRANLPVAVASTLVTNPVTFGPVYYGAYRLGKFILQEPEPTDKETARVIAQTQAEPPGLDGILPRLKYTWTQLSTVGKPLALGLFIIASASGVLIYFLFSGLWALNTKWSRHKRLRARQTGRARVG